jgi:hypothetical protein
MLTADRAAQLEDQGIHLLGDGQQPAHGLRAVQVQKGTCVYLAGQGVGQKGSRGFMPLQDILHPVQEEGKVLGWDGHVLNESHRLGLTSESVQTGQDGFAQAPKTLLVAVTASHQGLHSQMLALEKAIG